jgi:ATP-dependent DNA helicase RecQ
MVIEQQTELKNRLKEIFGYDQFRGKQEDIINSLLSGKNTFVIMPTGAGKSMCYQLPALLSEGTAIVISPLIALMKNQVDQMHAFSINARFLNSTLSKTELNKVKKETLTGEVKLLYVAPESLSKEENIEFFKKAKIAFVAIDEAHCISEWGHDFRPEYRKIRTIIDQLGNMPVIALTATATPKVQLDIQKNLSMEAANVFKLSFRRKNLYYEVRPKTNTKKQIVSYIKKNAGKSGIIYCQSRKKVEEVAELLNVNGIKARPYHAGLDADVRMKNQDDFLNEEVDVICATIAFGMGIDKPDVRFVIHYDVPKSLEGYYQETGRAGRDGLEGNCIMFYSYNDIIKLDKFNKDKPVTERENAKHLLEEMAGYAESSVCRVKQLLHYFGEFLTENCGNCDNCLHPKEKFEAKEDVLLALEAMRDTECRFPFSHVVNILTGIKDEYVKSYNHDKLEQFGEGKDQSGDYWHSVLRQLLLREYLEKDIDNYGLVKITQKGHDFMKDPEEIYLTKDHKYESTDPDDDDDFNSNESMKGAAADEVLLNMLKALRKKVASEKNLPPYVIFQDPSLNEMATIYPTNVEDMSHISGVGMAKAEKFGKPFIETIKKYIEENDIMTNSDVVIKSTVNKSMIKIFIIQQIDRKVPLENIAKAKEITMLDLIEEIEHICYSGTKLNLDYYLDDIMDEDRQEEVYDYFMSAETDKISDAIKELGADYSEEELRLMRVKFLSEVAL